MKRNNIPDRVMVEEQRKGACVVVRVRVLKKNGMQLFNRENRGFT